MYKPRDRQDIIHFLGLDDSINSSNAESRSIAETAVQRAVKIEKEFCYELSNSIYSYGLMCDFDSNPYVLEDEDDYDLREVARYNEGIVLYELIPKYESDEENTGE